MMLPKEALTGVRETAVVIARQQAGSYARLVLRAPAIAARFQPGTFVAAATGGIGGTILRRPLAILDARHSETQAPLAMTDETIELVVSPQNVGTGWLADRQHGESIDLLGPLGRPFAPPRPNGKLLLIGRGHGAVSLYSLAKEAVNRRAEVVCLLDGASHDRIFGVSMFGKLGASVSLTTDQGPKGALLSLLRDYLNMGPWDSVCACAPMWLLPDIVNAAQQFNTPVQVSLESGMACGTGLCLTCTLPMKDDAGRGRMLRVCKEGPVLDGTRVLWDDLNRVPEGCHAG